MKKKLSILLVAVLCFITVFSVPMVAQASMVDDAVPYEWGHTYSASMGYSSERYYSFKLSEKSNVYMKLTSDVTYQNGCWATIYNSSGETLVSSGDFTAKYNSVTGIVTQTTDRILPKGTYYVKIRSQGAYGVSYSFFATAEKAIFLSRPTIKTLKNISGQKMKVTLSSVKDRTGYEIQYATNSKFSGAKKATGSTTKTISKLKKGKTYYVRARAYAIYGSGNKVYSAWSIVKKVNIRK